ncbi:NADP-dependent oxidoreductase [Tessaracoccus rhinocerotis]|uniref:NADP-dependent oxidoreductase n=1 Tax=Tessaracoccus rhinocerotis TaxID=1689449 RepID=A0A553JZ68_9ACTN|nr:NADP-dependent oxidoreductase [Tessaracoccus rhinocerotis]TRY17734.1 NADP-dependent oxidoreductase [Tessaracoccus rhinocerotis]
MTKVYTFNDFGGPERQELIDAEIVDPGPGELAIEVRAAGVNPVDWKIRQGLLGKHGPLPMPMGREASGVVTAVGQGVTGFAVGDEVLGLVAPGHGAFAERTVLAADQTVAKPQEISFDDAATLPVAGATAYDLTHQVELKEGQTMVVVGAGGGIGRMAAQIGKVHKFDVVGVASAGKRELVESLGVKFVESGDGVAERLRQLLPDGADLVVDLAGGEALRAAAPIAKEPALVITAADVDTAREVGARVVERTSEGLAKITGVVQYGVVDPTVTARYPLAEAGAAIAEVEGGHAAGKVVVIP